MCAKPMTAPVNERSPELIPFTVASQLLRELGERLVGQAHIALAELVKNAYDADATKVQIRFEPDRIVVEDNGHGMNRHEFQHFWMRIGTPHKQLKRTSREFGRTMTGSKGVGRLAVQFLARDLDLYTVAKKRGSTQLHAHVNWDQAVEVGELTEATAAVWSSAPSDRFPGNSRHGTRLEMKRLEQEWETQSFQKLAQEIWFLEPPFGKAAFVAGTASEAGFEVVFDTDDPDAEKEFDRQMSAILRIWHAKINGKLIPPEGKGKPARLSILVEFQDGERFQHEETIEEPLIDNLEYEVRVFHFEHRQRFGILVQKAREYADEFGGINIYDGGFRLPYYGALTDWLDVEKDHARRLSLSNLLPDELQVPGGMTFLPSNRRLMGVVNVNTTKEAQSSRACRLTLQIQISRDRLVANEAYKQLQFLVRLALDFYAVHEKRRSLIGPETLWDKLEPVRRKVLRVEQVLESFEREIPGDVYDSLNLRITAAVEASETEAERTAQQLAIMGTLATAGITALATEHQVGQQLAVLEHNIARLKKIAVVGKPSKEELQKLAEDLTAWLDRVRATRGLFTSLMDEKSRDTIAPMRALAVLNTTKEQVSPLMRGVNIETSGVSSSLRLPAAALAEWSAIFQNIFFNAFNAMIDSDQKRIRVFSGSDDKRQRIVIEDTGVGIDLEEAERLFEPFERELELSPRRRELGLGGTGLGLTIVRMLAGNRGCDVSFIPPLDDYRTALELSWNSK